MRSQEDVAAMQCPVCRVPLAMSDRQGIEIDYCPQCRGVWLNRGELDKIIERSAPQVQPAPPAGGRQAELSQGQGPRGSSGYGDADRGRYSHGKPYKKRKSWLEELFD